MTTPLPPPHGTRTTLSLSRELFPRQRALRSCKPLRANDEPLSTHQTATNDLRGCMYSGVSGPLKSRRHHRRQTRHGPLDAKVQICSCLRGPARVDLDLKPVCASKAVALERFVEIQFKQLSQWRIWGTEATPQQLQAVKAHRGASVSSLSPL